MPEYKLVRHFGLSKNVASLLVEAGYRLPKVIRRTTDEALLTIEGIDSAAVEAIRTALGPYQE